MSKYSIQNECLEMIEAFSDEQMSSDMAVIESVLDIFDKTILMMELSNEPVDIPDVSMFMESAFFQEENEGENNGDGERSDTAPASDQSSSNNTSSDNNTQNNTMSDADRKAYNKEHWVRMKNKEGKLENIFISIIAFIPRLLGFIIQCIVRFFKKLFNKEADEEIKKSDSSVQTLSPEEITEAVSKTNAGSVESTVNANSSESKEPPAQSSAPATPTPTPAPANNNAQPPQPNATNEQKNAGTINPQTKMWEWYDEQAIIKCIDDAEKIINLFTLDNYANIEKLKKFMPDITRRLDAVMNSRIEVQGNVLVNSKNNIAKRFDAFEKSINGTKAELDKYIEDNNLIKKKLFGKDEVSSRGQVVLDLKNSVSLLKNFAQSFSNVSNDIVRSYNAAVRKARALNNAAANKGSSQPQAQPQPPVNNEGGENNGGQNQNNQSNAG